MKSTISKGDLLAQHDSGEDRDKELTMTCSGVLEMKTSRRATKQLYAYTIHTGSQTTVKALKEGKVVVVYSLAANYLAHCTN